MNEWTKVAAKLYAQQQIVKEAIKYQESLRAELKKLSYNSSHADGIYQFTKELRAGVIDFGAIPGIKELNLEEYRKPPIEVWKLELRLPSE